MRSAFYRAWATIPISDILIVDVSIPVQNISDIVDSNNVPGYIVTMSNKPLIEIERIQTGVRLEKHLLKVLKALAELKDLTLGDLLEGIVLHAFEGKVPFSADTLKEIELLRKIYGLTLRASDSHQLKERRK